jgi:hypothetical protein
MRVVRRSRATRSRRSRRTWRRRRRRQGGTQVLRTCMMHLPLLLVLLGTQGPEEVGKGLRGEVAVQQRAAVSDCYGPHLVVLVAVGALVSHAAAVGCCCGARGQVVQQQMWRGCCWSRCCSGARRRGPLAALDSAAAVML